MQSKLLYLYNLGTSPLTLTGAYFSGANAADFTVAGYSCSGGGAVVPPDGFCSVTVTFNPSAAGLRSAALNFVDDAPDSPQQLALSGTGRLVATGQIVSVSSSVIDFGFSNLGVPVRSTNIRFTNTGSAGVTLTGVSISGGAAADFQVLSSTCGSTLKPTAFCDVYVQLVPTVASPRIASLTLANNSATGAATVSLVGEGQALQTNVFVYPAVGVGSTTFYIENYGTAPLAVLNANVTGAYAGDFSVTNQCIGLVSPAGQCSIVVNVNGAGPESASLNIVTSAGTLSAPVYETDYAVGVYGALAVTSSAISPSIPVNTSTIFPAAGLYVFGSGISPISINSLTLTGTNATDFSITSKMGAEEIDVQFAPRTRGPKTANLVVGYTGAPGSPQTVVLNGFAQ